MADKHCMRDRELRPYLRNELMCQYHARDAGTLIIDEMPICRHSARADLAVVNGHLAGYEIKSERDTLQRLEHQQEAYGKVFDYVTIVASERHLAVLPRLVPDWWGVTEAFALNGDIRFREIREATANPQPCPVSICQILWRNEALDILESRGLVNKDTSLPRRKLWQRIAENVPLDELRSLVRGKLKSRGHSGFVALRTRRDG